MTKKDKNINRFRHDHIFRLGLAIPEVAKEIMEMNLPSELLQKLDLSSLKQIPETFVEKSLQKQIVDILFSCNTKKKEDQIFLYILCESQSTPEYWMSMRLLKYMLAICERFKQENPDAKKLPLVYPMVIYNGMHPHNAPRNFYELFEYPEIAKNILENSFPLSDLTKIEDEKLKKKIWGGTLLFFMKHAHRRQLLDLLKQMSLSLKQIYNSHYGIDLLHSILCYNKVEELEANEQKNLSKLLIDITDKQVADNLMGTLAQAWLEEGEQKGLRKGRQEAVSQVVLNMLKSGMSIEQIAQVTGLSVSEIRDLSKEVK